MKFLLEYEARSDEAAQRSEHGQAAWSVAPRDSAKHRANSEHGKERPKHSAGMAPNFLYSLLFITFLLSFSACKKDRISIPWTLLDSGTTYDLQDVHFVSADTGFVAGGARWTFGVMLETTDGGDTWSNDSISTKEINAIDAISSSNVYSVGFGNTLLTNKGTPNWQFYELSSWMPLNGLAIHESGRGLAVGGGSYLYGIIYRFDENLNIDTLPLLVHELMDVAYTNANTAHIVGYGLVMKSIDGGLNWTKNEVGGDFFQAVSFPSEQVGYSVGLQGSIIKTTDGGETWETLRNSNRLTVKRHKFRDVCFVTEDKGYIVGHEGLFWKTEDGGITWEEVEGMPETDFHAIHYIEDSGYIVGKEGSILKFSD